MSSPHSLDEDEASVSLLSWPGSPGSLMSGQDPGCNAASLMSSRDYKSAAALMPGQTPGKTSPDIPDTNQPAEEDDKAEISSPLPQKKEVNEPDRRYSARLLSQSVAQTLRQLKREEHESKVVEIVKKNSRFYHRQAICEAVFVWSAICSFTVFSIYTVLNYGFAYFVTPQFEIVSSSPEKVTKKVGDSVDLMCKADYYWEWCRWIHLDQYCEWEWKSPEEGVALLGCDMTEDGREIDMRAGREQFRDTPIVTRMGDYQEFECGLRFTVRPEHRGTWICELEKYHQGFGRRYGEVRTKALALVVPRKHKLLHATSMDPSTSSSNMTTSSTPSLNATTTEVDMSHCYKISATNQCLSEKQADDERNFLILRVVVRTAVVVTLVTLAVAFALLFLRNWRNWDKQINRACVIDVEEAQKEDPDFEEEHPMLTVALGDSRRKSVSFSVCVLDDNFKNFDLEKKKVLLGLGGGGGTPQQSACNLPTLYEQEMPEKTALQVPLMMRRKVSTKQHRPRFDYEYEDIVDCREEEGGADGLVVPSHKHRRNSMPPVPLDLQLHLAMDNLSNSNETVI